jgi:transcriptional regulator with XRE-family HTH domain
MPNPMHDPRYSVYRALLIELRERKALTQVEIAARLDKPQSYVSKYERGERRLDIIEMIDVATALEADPIAVLHELITKL